MKLTVHDDIGQGLSWRLCTSIITKNYTITNVLFLVDSTTEKTLIADIDTILQAIQI